MHMKIPLHSDSKPDQIKFLLLINFIINYNIKYITI